MIHQRYYSVTAGIKPELLFFSRPIQKKKEVSPLEKREQVQKISTISRSL